MTPFRAGLPDMIRRRMLTLTGAIFLTLLAGEPAGAQSSVVVRTGDHEGYVRVVFDVPQKSECNVTQNGNVLQIAFDKVMPLDARGVDAGPEAPIRALSQISAPGQPLKLQMTMAANSRSRQSTAGRSVIIDVFAAEREKTNERADMKKEQPATAAKAQVPKKPDAEALAMAPVQKPAAAPQKAVKTTKAVETKSSAETALPAVKTPPASAPEPAAPVLAGHTITLATTQTVGMAAFERAGYLWLVFDRPELSVPPELAGPTPDIFGPFTKYELKGGRAFRLKLPEGNRLNFYGAGGGLVWRIVMTPEMRESDPIIMARHYGDSQASLRGGTAGWAMPGVTKILDLPDPAVGDVLKVATVASANLFTGPAIHLIDFSMLHSIVGMAIQSHVDNLMVDVLPTGIQISRPDGLALSRKDDVNRQQMRQNVQEASPANTPVVPGAGVRRIYDFDRWMLGGIQALRQNQTILLASMANKDQSGRVQDLLTLAKMNIANDRGQEAIGFLRYAADEMPDVAQSPEYMALRAAAHDLAGKFELALADLQSPALREYSELDYWRAFTFAGLEDWHAAAQIMPKDFSVLVGYPKPLLEKIGLKLAEVSLRNGDTDMAQNILGNLQRDRGGLKSWTIAGIDYLEGEVFRQKKDPGKARMLWDLLIKGKDDFYRARAGLAETMMELQTGVNTTDQAIDRLEGLRYAWRGDELEAQINFTLGKLYMEKNRYAKAFGILKDASTMSPDADVGKEITSYMMDSFKNLMLNDKTITPLDAVTVYEEFRGLTPPGADGNAVIQKLAERLVETDLLGRATDVLQHQVDYRLTGEEKGKTALRLAAIYLLDRNPSAAMKALDVSRAAYSASLTGSAKDARLKEIELLHARTLSQMNHAEEAITLLNKFEPSPEVNRLRADISWRAGLWDDAAQALQDLIIDEALDPARSLTPYQADLILNRAVALNLSGNRIELANMFKRYGDPMKKTARARLFEVVTRPRTVGMGMIGADRETLDSIVAEVDMFKDFLEAYRTAVATNSSLTAVKIGH